MISTSPLSVRMPTKYYRGYRYFWHENGIKLPLRGEATKHFANEEEAKAYIDSLTAPPVSWSPLTSKTQETSGAVALGIMSGAVTNRIGGLPAWLIRVSGLMFSFLIVSFFLFSLPNSLHSTATTSGPTSGTSRSATVQTSTGNNGEKIVSGMAPASRPAPVYKDHPPPERHFWVSPQ